MLCSRKTVNKMFEMNDFSSSTFGAKLTRNTLLSTDELAALLKVSPKTVRKWRYTKEIEAVKVGKKLVRFRWGDIQKWLEGR